ncbi:hypothetical protein ACTID9_16300 [Brevibacillus fluminis]|uniref:hypothetical protein n=1 Tax=Brevibacillus fluminis TaxID=511487 RepID=UPI003F8BB907
MTIESQIAYILSCQLPTGTFRLGSLDARINPYFTNLALLSLVESGECDCARQQLDWYLGHLHADSYVNDYVWQDGKEIDTGKADSEDSYPATFFLLALAYVDATGDFAWAYESREKLYRILAGLLALQQKDGLTWAKRSWKVKYLMDNCEVVQGLYAAEKLFGAIGEHRGALQARQAAERCADGIDSMYSEKKAAYAVYDRHFPNWRKWYPDATSQAFPVLSGMLDAGSDIALSLYRRLIEHFPRFEWFETGDQYPWMSMGEWACVMGDATRAAEMTIAAERLYIHGPRHPYWLIQDAAGYIHIKTMLGTAQL